MGDNILEIKDVSKLYPGVTALNHINLSFRRGEIHALCGENGAGKSTLIKTISGAITPTAGSITINGETFSELTPALAREKGVAVVYQEFTLVPVLTAAENIFMGNFRKKGLMIDRKTMYEEAAKIFARMGIKLDPRSKVQDLTTGYQQIVEIAKAVSYNAKILIMDEPSAPLTTNEVEAMMDIVRTLKREGVTIIYISHRMEEIFELADRVSVLRDGEYIGTKDIQDTNHDDLIRMMVGRTLSQTYPKRNCKTDEVVLEARNLSGNGVKNISFQLHRGEILGLGGLIGAGRTELCEMIFGYYPIQSGELYLHGQMINPSSPSDAVKKGIALVPEDRKKHGIIGGMTVLDNLTLSTIKKLTKNAAIDRKAQKKYAQDQVDALGIKTPGLMQKVKNLSGGNQQKVILGRWLGANPEIFIFDEPTRGIDVGAKALVLEALRKFNRENGVTIVVISSELEELRQTCDRIAIVSGGEIAGILPATRAAEEFGMLMVSKVK